MNCIPEVQNCIYMKAANFVSVVYTLHGYFQLSGLQSQNQYEKDNIYNKQCFAFDFECSFWDSKCTWLYQMTYHKTLLVFSENKTIHSAAQWKCVLVGTKPYLPLSNSATKIPSPNFCPPPHNPTWIPSFSKFGFHPICQICQYL